MYSSYNSLYTSFLYHSGVKGMKWGIRRKAAKETRHIYEKIGFKKNKRISNEDDVWSGLTSMTYKYKNGGKH